MHALPAARLHARHGCSKACEHSSAAPLVTPRARPPARTQDKARQLRLSGFVRNRLDGRVEVVAEGDEPELQQLLAWLHTGSPAADVSGVQAEWGAATGEFCGFDRLWTA